MKPSDAATVYTCPGHVCWFKDTDQLVIVDEREQRNFFLSGPEATIWTWLELLYSYQEMLKLIAALLATSREAAEEKLLSLLMEWRAAGLLVSSSD